MSLPICEICAKSGLLCNSCEEKLSGGKISEADVELSRILYGLGGGDISFNKAIESRDAIIVLTKKDSIGKLIGKNGTTIRTISDKLGKLVKVIGIGELDDMIYDLFAPAKVIGINKVYQSDGKMARSVKISSKDKAKLRMEIGDIKKIIASLSDEQINIGFD